VKVSNGAVPVHRIIDSVCLANAKLSGGDQPSDSACGSVPPELLASSQFSASTIVEKTATGNPRLTATVSGSAEGSAEGAQRDAHEIMRFGSAEGRP
jgi:hypothetical protein